MYADAAQADILERQDDEDDKAEAQTRRRFYSTSTAESLYAVNVQYKHVCVYNTKGVLLCTASVDFLKLQVQLLHSRVREFTTIVVNRDNASPVHSAVGVTIHFSRKRRCYVLTNVSSVSNGSAWIGVGSYIRGVHDGVGMTAVMLQPGAVFRIARHVFYVVSCLPVRRAMAVKHVAAPVPLPAAVPNEYAVTRHIPTEIANDELAQLSMVCIFPYTTSIYNKQISVPYNYGGNTITIGSGGCSIPIADADSGLDAVHCRIVALMGQFWILDGSHAAKQSTSGTFVQMLPTCAPVALRTVTSPVHVVLGDTDTAAVKIDIVRLNAEA